MTTETSDPYTTTKHTNIAYPLLQCHMCKYKWRSYQMERCSSCSRGFGIPYLDIMILGREEDLMEAVHEIKPPPAEPDETYMCVKHTIMKYCWWYRLGTIWNAEGCWNAQACWLYLRTQPITPEITLAMDHFKDTFEELVVYLDEQGAFIHDEYQLE